MRVQIAFLGEGAGQEDPLLLAAGEVADLALRIGQHVDLFEALAGDLAILPAPGRCPSRSLP